MYNIYVNKHAYTCIKIYNILLCVCDTITANKRNLEFEKKCKQGIYKDLESRSQQGK